MVSGEHYQQLQDSSHRRKKPRLKRVNLVAIRDDKVRVIEVDFKLRKQWEPLSRVILDGGVGVNILGEDLKQKLGNIDLKPTSFRSRWLTRVVQVTRLFEIFKSEWFRLFEIFKSK
ncbi:hypothetical protein GOP47_0029599 [Adiantum capillus-veneris]|nr:hypothetical protein GOP47_0029599 [Adiantum capillus-veneris]